MFDGTADGTAGFMSKMVKIAWAVLLAPCIACAGEYGTALKNDALRAEPFLDAQAVATLAAGDKVDIIKREGGWLQVKAGGQQGWVHMLSIRRGEAHKGSGEAAGVLGLPSGRSGTGGLVVSTGIRGMNVGSTGAASGTADAEAVQSTADTGGPGGNEPAADAKAPEEFAVK